MILSLLLVLLGNPQQVIPFKPNDEFQLEVDYKFKVRTGFNDTNFRIDYEKDLNKGNASGPLPYLIINFKTLKLSDQEVRVRVVNNLGKLIVSKKIEVGETFKLDMGFTDDMKDRVTAFEYTIFFLNPKKVETTSVQLYVHEDGTFLVNGEKRGKF